MTESVDNPESAESGPTNNVMPAQPAPRIAMTGGELLGALILWLAHALLFIACLSILWQDLISLPDKVFPNRSGLSDLARSEIFFYGLWIFLTWRYVIKVIQHGAAPHRAIYRYVLAFGIHTMLFTSIGVTLFLEMSPEPDLLDDWVDFLSIIEELTWLLLLFALVPKGSLILPDAEKKEGQASSENREGTEPQ